MSPKELLKQMASIKIKHSIIRELTKGRNEENKGLWNQLIFSMSWNFESWSLWTVLRVLTLFLTTSDLFTEKQHFSQY